MLIMGYAGSFRTWPVSFVEGLAQTFLVLSYDNLGTGQTAPLARVEDYTIARMAQSVAEVSEDAKWTRFHLLGYSMGGCIALQYAHEHTAQVETLFLMATTSGGSGRIKAAPEVSQALINPSGETLWDMYLSTFKVMFSEERFPLVMTSIKGIYEQAKDFAISPTTLKGHDRAFKSFDGTSFVPALTMPVTILVGADDRLISCQDALAMGEQLPHARLVILPDCGHAPHIQNESEVIAEIVSLAEHAGSSN
jgi:pimeloyl-ACP methyl ester carboxylesterase